MAIEIRMLQVGDEPSLLEAQTDLARDDFQFAFGLADDPNFSFGADFPTYVAHVEGLREGRGVHEGWVASTFLVAVDGDQIVGRVSVRHQLNDYLANYGGHIGYGVKSTHRRRGIATQLLAAGLSELRRVGVTRALVTCDHDNEASATVIERAGGRFEGEIEGDPDGVTKRRYWIDLTTDFDSP